MNAPFSDVQLTALSTGTELAQAATLYREVFGYTDPIDGLSPKLLRGLADNGGLVIGALSPAGELLGFSYGFRSQDDAGPYHYSQAAVVATSAQGQHIGRKLKYKQAELAFNQGLGRMRWAYDPLQVRNGHFNLNVLGAQGIAFHRDYYQDGDSHRIIVEWDLEAACSDSSGAEPQVSESAQEVPASSASGFAVMVPLDITRPQQPTRPGQPANPAAQQLREIEGVMAELEEGFSRGLVLRSCEAGRGQDAKYLFDLPTKFPDATRPHLIGAC